LTDPASRRLALEEPDPPHFRWNAPVFMLESALFTVAMSFLGTTTILPSLILKLSGSSVIVGLASGLQGGAWLLPQLLVASAIAHKPRQTPIMRRWAWIGRPIFLLVAGILWRWGLQLPGLALAAVMGGVVVFFALDAVVSVPWFSVLAKTIPANRRGRLLGIGQMLGGLGGVGVGMVARYLLGEGSPLGFPENHALLLAAAAIIFLISAIFLSAIREPEAAQSAENVPSVGAVLRSLPGILAKDGHFVRLIIVRIIGGFAGLASSFYVLYATRHLGLSDAAVGLFLSAQVVGSLVAGLVLGATQDRWGPLVNMRVLIVLSMVPPLLALSAAPLQRAVGEGVLYLYLLLYFFLGIYASSAGWPFFNWILEYADETRRPLYIGLLNTLGAATMLAPTLGGWLVEALSYPAAFVAAILFALIAGALSLALPCTRRKGATGR
jgi:hypothetical protein